MRCKTCITSKYLTRDTFLTFLCFSSVARNVKLKVRQRYFNNRKGSLWCLCNGAIVCVLLVVNITTPSWLSRINLRLSRLGTCFLYICQLENSLMGRQHASDGLYVLLYDVVKPLRTDCPLGGVAVMECLIIYVRTQILMFWRHVDWSLALPCCTFWRHLCRWPSTRHVH